MEAKAIAIAGWNASGKTQMVERMRRQMKADTVRYVAFCDTYGTATDRTYYLQQRWNQHDIDTETPTVGQSLERSFLLSGSDTPERRHYQQQLYDMMGLGQLTDKYVISLSSGELRKMQLTKALMAQPQTLILDNPYIGLDTEARRMLTQMLLTLKRQGIALYMVVARPADIPDFIDEVIWTTPQHEFQNIVAEETVPTGGGQSGNTPEIVRLNDVSIRYGTRTILNHLTWSIHAGEHWALSGRNGSGKSTLLSLLCADNPQSYACDITLFGQKRGSGETVWDIKRRIGYVSPELHRAYQRPLPALHIVASGLRDTVGLYTHATQQEEQTCRQWMERFGLEHLAQRTFTQLSSGEQRLMLVCRAFVKNPDLLILDEPMHGLDLRNQRLVQGIIDEYCRDDRKTLIMVTHYPDELPRCIDRHKQL